MRISSLTEYGLRCLMVLAREADRELVSTREIVEAEDLSRDFVEQIMLRLRRAELVQSVRGVHGGYRLARSSGEISALDVMLALEKESLESICQRHVGHREGCESASNCALRNLCDELRAAMEAVLSEATLTRLAAHPACAPDAGKE